MTMTLADPERLELEAFCGRERSGSPQPNLRRLRGVRAARRNAEPVERIPSAADASQTLADPERLELPTSAFEAHCSIQLSYGSAFSLSLAGLTKKSFRVMPRTWRTAADIPFVILSFSTKE